MKILVKKLKRLLKNKCVVDLIIFGSLSKGRINPPDIDLALIHLENLDKHKLRKEIKTINSKIDLQFIGIEKYNHFIWLTLMREGYSIKHNKYLYDLYNIKPQVLYKYSLKQLSPSKKVMFERAIKSFKDINKLSNRVILVPIKLSSDFSDFLKSWGLEFESAEYGLMPLVRKEI